MGACWQCFKCSAKGNINLENLHKAKYIDNQLFICEILPRIETDSMP